MFHGATPVNNEYIVIFGGKTSTKKSSSFYVLRPKESKPSLDIEEDDIEE